MKQTTVKPFEFNPLDPEFILNPYPFYSRLHNQESIHRSPLGMWIISRYDEVYQALRDPRFSSQPSPYSVHAKRNQKRYVAAQVVVNLMPFMDPPDHTRLKTLVGKAFNAQLKDIPPRVEVIVNELLSKVEKNGFLDIVNDFSALLPVWVISDLLGIPASDREMVKKWAHWFFYIFSPSLSSEINQNLNQALVEFHDYFIALIKQRRNNPQDDLISTLIQVRDEQEKLTEDELINTCLLLFANGEETTVSLIANGILALLKHPEQLKKLKQNPSLIENTVEEILRYDGPAQLIGRTAQENITIRGKIIKQYDPVFLVLGAANRDSEKFDYPEEFDITRHSNHRHLAFGGGIHSCLGASLARLETQIAINAIVQKLSNLQLSTDTLQWREHIGHRGLKSLPVTFDI